MYRILMQVKGIMTLKLTTMKTCSLQCTEGDTPTDLLKSEYGIQSILWDLRPFTMVSQLELEWERIIMELTMLTLFFLQENQLSKYMEEQEI